MSSDRLPNDIEPVKVDIPLMSVVVGSSNIAGIGYDGKAKALFIRFHNGAIWRYAPVPVESVRAMSEADSIGAYFSQHIRGGSGINATLAQPKPEEGA